MIGKIIPQIYSAKKRLLFTESLCFLYSEGFEISLPSGNFNNEQNLITLKFRFEKNENDRTPSFRGEAVAKDLLQFTLYNFDSPLGTGTSTPIDVSIGGQAYSLFFYVECLTPNSENDQKLINMTISMYGDVA